MKEKDNGTSALEEFMENKFNAMEVKALEEGEVMAAEFEIKAVTRKNKLLRWRYRRMAQSIRLEIARVKEGID